LRSGATRLEAACQGDDWQETPRLRCLGFDWSVRSNDPALLRYVTWLYDACSTGAAPAHHFVVRRRTASSNASTTVYRDGTAVVRHVPPGLAVARLVWEVNQGVVAEPDNRLLLHAAAAAQDGAVVVLPGPRGAGKSTLVAALVDAGLRYVTDEAVAIEPSTLGIEPYPKPIALDRDAPVLAHLNVPIPEGLDSGVEQRFAPPQLFRADAVASRGGVARIILFVKYQPDRPATLRRMSRAKATVALAENSFNFRSLGPGALTLVADVVRASDCYRLDVDDLEVACRRVAALLDGLANSRR
jgi:hypothetical protein